MKSQSQSLLLEVSLRGALVSLFARWAWVTSRAGFRLVSCPLYTWTTFWRGKHGRRRASLGMGIAPRLSLGWRAAVFCSEDEGCRLRGHRLDVVCWWGKITASMGVVFDYSFIWKEHDRCLRDSCSRGIEVVQTLAQTTWGANRATLVL